jgi:hypothetical protein
MCAGVAAAGSHTSHAVFSNSSVPEIRKAIVKASVFQVGESAEMPIAIVCDGLSIGHPQWSMNDKKQTPIVFALWSPQDGDYRDSEIFRNRSISAEIRRL